MTQNYINHGTQTFISFNKSSIKPKDNRRFNQIYKDATKKWVIQSVREKYFKSNFYAKYLEMGPTRRSAAMKLSTSNEYIPNVLLHQKEKKSVFA